MRRLLPLGATALAGCIIFLDEAPPADSEGDAAPAVDATPACTGSRDTVNAVLIDDTLLSNGGSAADLNFDDFGTVTITPEFPAVGLLRFETSTLPDNAEISGVELTLPHAFEADECGAGSCSSCAGIARSGELHVVLVANDWVAREVTWNERSVGVAWQQPGARGSDDRGPVLGTASYSADTAAVIDLTIDRANIGEQTSLLVEGVGDDDDVMSVKMIGATRENDCAGNAAQPFATLTLEYCLP